MFSDSPSDLIREFVEDLAIVIGSDIVPQIAQETTVRRR